MLKTDTARTGPATPASIEFDRLLAERYSCRAFLAEPVADDVIDEMLRIAQRSASWCNSQPWQVIITKGAGTERFRQAFFKQASENRPDTDLEFPADYVGVYRQRRRDCAMALYGSIGIESGDRAASAKQMMENFRFFGAPHLAVITTDRNLGVYGAVDCGAFVGAFLLAARSLGVATIAQAAIATQSGFIRDQFKIPADRMVVCGISFGYEDAEHPVNRFRTTRAPLSEVVQWVTE
jgi:nitroreductase